jgi:hypothetical protein
MVNPVRTWIAVCKLLQLVCRREGIKFQTTV